MPAIKELYKFFSARFQNVLLDYRFKVKPRWNSPEGYHQGLYEIIKRYNENYEKLINDLIQIGQPLQNQNVISYEGGGELIWTNGFLPGLDILSIFAIPEIFKPKCIMEVGSGTSTQLFHLSREIHNLDYKIISIDPEPRKSIDKYCDEVIRLRLEDIDLDTFQRIKANDILFIDNSHLIFPNSDSMVFYLDILFNLPPGAIIHIHDIYLPFDYPQFMCDRYYNEQYGLAIAMLSNPERFEFILPNFYISQHKFLSKKLDTFWEFDSDDRIEKHGGSFWFKIKH